MLFALRLALLLPTMAAFAQNAPFVTHLSELPIIKRLEQTPNWKTLDSETAIGLLQLSTKINELLNNPL